MRMCSIHRASLIGLLLTSALALAAGFGPSVGSAYLGLKQGGYLFTFGLLAFWALGSIPVIVSEVRKEGLDGLYLALGGGLLLLGTAVFLSVEPEWRVMDDEAVLQTTALSMHHAYDVAAAEKGYWISGEFEVLQMRLDKRPFLYPFVVSLFHHVLGYDVSNAFRVNLLCGLGALLLGFLLFVRWFGKRLAFLALLPLCASPVFVVAVRSGGFDAMNFLFAGIFGLSILVYLRRPAPREEAFLVLTAVVLAYLRYESVIAVPVAGIVLLWVGFRRRRLEFSPVTVLCPFLLVPFVWLFRCTVARVGSWEVDSARPAVFAWKYVSGNLRDAVAFFLDPRWAQANDVVLTIAGIVGLTWWLLTRSRKTMRAETGTRFGGSGVWLLWFLLVLLILQGYFWSSFLDVLAQRLSLPFVWPLSFGLAFLLWRSGCARTRRWWIAFGFILAGVVGSALPSLYQQPVRNEPNHLARLQNWKAEWISAQSLRPESTLFIDENPLIWTMLRWSALRISTLSGRMAALQFHWDANSFEKIYYVQIARRSAAGDWIAGIPLNPHLVLGSKPVAEYTMAPDYACRIFEVVDMHHPSNRYEAFWETREAEADSVAVQDAFRAAWIRNLP